MVASSAETFQRASRGACVGFHTERIHHGGGRDETINRSASPRMRRQSTSARRNERFRRKFTQVADATLRWNTCQISSAGRLRHVSTASLSRAAFCTCLAHSTRFEVSTVQNFIELLLVSFARFIRRAISQRSFSQTLCGRCHCCRPHLHFLFYSVAQAGCLPSVW